MSSTDTDETIVLETGHTGIVWGVAFHPDENHILCGTDDGIQHWRLSDGQQLKMQMGVKLRSISASRDHRWIVCGTYRQGASVWNGEMDDKVASVEGTNYVGVVDISPDSAVFATGTGGMGNNDNSASIWDIESGERLVGPLKHDSAVSGVKFSPDGDRIATSCFRGRSIRIFSRLDGDELITIKATLDQWTATTPLAWSNDAQDIFGIFRDKKIRSFSIASKSQLTTSSTLAGSDILSIDLAPNGKFIATFTRPRSILFLDASTLAQIGPIINDDRESRSIAVSPDSNYVATGHYNGQVVVRDLGKILPDKYGPFHVSTHEEVAQEEQPVASDDNSNKAADANVQDPGKSKSEGRNEDEDGDLLEVSLSAPAADFDFEEPPSPVSPTGHRENATPRDARSEAQRGETANASQGPSIFERLLQRKRNKDPTSEPHTPGRRFGKSQPTDSHAPARKEGRSRMAAAQVVPRTSTGFPRRKKFKAPVTQQHSSEGASSSGQGATDQAPPNAAQQANDGSQASPSGVHLTHRPDTGHATLAITFPAWLLCIRSGAHDGAD